MSETLVLFFLRFTESLFTESFRAVLRVFSQRCKFRLFQNHTDGVASRHGARVPIDSVGYRLDKFVSDFLVPDGRRRPRRFRAVMTPAR